MERSDMKRFRKILLGLVVLGAVETATAMPLGVRMALWNRSARNVQTYSIGEVLGGTWVTGTNGMASAKGCDDATAAGGKSVKFSAADDSVVWIETVFTNACRVSFDWKCSCEALVKGRPYDYMAFSVDGAQRDFICGETGWTSVTNYVTGDGEHLLRWMFQRDDDGSSGEDCAWLANVKAVPSVTLTFAGGGATEGTLPEPIMAYADECIVLPGPGSLAWPKHTFLGWDDGMSLYAAGSEYSVGAAAVAGQPPCLTAVWEANTLSAPVITASATYEGESCTVTISADGGATIFYTIDGTDPMAARSATAPYQWVPATSTTVQYQGAFEVEGSVTIKAIAVRDDYFDSEVAVANVTRLTWTFGEYLNWPEQTFTTGGDASWTRVKGVSADGYALRSGVITHSQTSLLETVVSGPGTVTFSCKVAGEIVKKTVYDGLAFCIDGVQQGELMGNTVWATNTFEIVGEGLHTLNWLYVKDDGDMLDVGEDCAWLEEVSWTPSSVSDVPSVLGDPEAVVTGDAESGYTVKPSATSGAVEVEIPSGVDAAKVTVEVPPTVESVTPHGATIKIVKGGHDITDLLDIPESSGTQFIASATVKEAIVKEPLDTTKGAEIDLKPSAPSITTAPTRPGLTYTFKEGTTIEGMTQKAEKQGDGQPWSPTISVKDGPSGFYSIGVGK